MSVQYIWGTGRRKTSVARVRVKPGAGEFKVNGRGFDEYFQTDAVRVVAKGPLKATGAGDRFDVFVNVSGGGPVGQAGAVRLGVARALLKADATLEPALREAGFLTRDARMKERKKYGQRGARRRFQFSKR
ncbi:MAG TPA: 30S ribosomal protein S9 [Planctomycetota bacterium]|nr:30S ribosomal protein S9 [Planctomycetota bacterium]